LDRIHSYNPGWEVAVIRHELFTEGYGFVVDYIAEILKHLRTEDFTGIYKHHFEVTSEVSTRDQTGFEKTFSGLMKILYPHGGATVEEIEEILAFAMEGRRRVREHILRIDDTFKPHDFIYQRKGGGEHKTVLTPEELQYPAFSGAYRPPTAGAPAGRPVEPAIAPGGSKSAAEGPSGAVATPANAEDALAPKAGHLVIPENSKGWSYRKIFANHLRGARKITVRDPYVRAFFQARNLMELLQVVHDLVPEGDEVAVHLVTQSDMDTCVKQEENLNQLVQSFTGSRVAFSWEHDHSPNFHARSITTDHGWKITIDRGLDIFQRFDTGAFSLEQAMQELRLARGAEVNYVKL
jgi:ATP-dependent Lon protease